jgi:transposase InsO family protein
MTTVANAARRVVTRLQSKVERDQIARGQNTPPFPGFVGIIDMAAAHRGDRLLSRLIEWKIAKVTPTVEQLTGLPEEVSIFMRMWDELEVKDGVLVRNLPARHGLPAKRVVVLPEPIRSTYVEACHQEAGHQGRAKTCERVARRCYFPRWRTYVATVCSKCTVCNAFGRGNPNRQGYMVLQEINEPMGRLAIDLTGPHPPSRRKNIYILTVTDCMTRYLIAVPLRNRFATTVASALLKYVFCRFGLCREILSDQGTEFNNKLLLSLLTSFGIRKLRTSGYRPQANGRSERQHRDMNAMFAKMIDGDPSDWDIVLDAVVMCYNGSVNGSTGYTPNYLMFGREALTPLDLEFPLSSSAVDYDQYNYCDYVNKLHEILAEVYEAARLKSANAAQLRKRTYDATVKYTEFQEGDTVGLKRESLKPGEYKKWTLHYEGPYVVIRRLNDVNYVIKRHPVGEERTVHVDRLRRF